MNKARETSVPEHLMLTVLGRNPSTARYALGGQQFEARLAPVALYHLLPPRDRPVRMLALCTAQARRDSWPLLEQALGTECQVDRADVPDGDTQDDINSYLAQTSRAIDGMRDVDLTVDVTHGYRHFSFLTYIAVLYLAAFRGVKVKGAYYGLLRKDEPSPFLDLRPLLELPRWLHALEVLRDTGSTAPMAEALRREPRNQSSRTIERELLRLSEGYLSGLPLEFGRCARVVRERHLYQLRKVLERDHRLPLATELVERLDKLLEPFALNEAVSGDGWKRRVSLSKGELERQARIVDDLLDHGNVSTALGLMNEWVVSWATWRHREDEWLDYRKTRRRAGHLLGAITAIAGDPELHHVLTNEQRSLGDFWGKLCELRNAYHHHGMRPQVLVGGPQIEAKLDGIRGFWQETLRSCPDFSLSLGESSGRRVLVSPIGMRPGVLFSALQACRTNGDTGEPAICLVVCSHESEELIDEAARRAGYSGGIEPLLLEDPHGGRPEIERLVKATRRHFVGADEVTVNVTGGTTLMGLIAEALAAAARELACPVRRFGLIDRRPAEQQDADPYRTGEPFWLDSAEDGDADND